MSMNLAQDNHCPDLLYVSFNQDYGCFACGTESGFVIFNCEPQKERFRRGNYIFYARVAPLENFQPNHFPILFK